MEILTIAFIIAAFFLFLIFMSFLCYGAYRFVMVSIFLDDEVRKMKRDIGYLKEHLSCGAGFLCSGGDDCASDHK